jgi:hypothetical protein
MPWYNSDRIEPGEMGEPVLPVVVSSTGKAEAFPRYYEPYDFTFAPCQPVESSMYS